MKKISLHQLKFIFIGLAIVLFIVWIIQGKKQAHYAGYVEAENLYVIAPYAGHILHQHVRRGEVVKKGQLLVELDPEPESLNKQQLIRTVVEAESLLNDLKKPKRPIEIKILSDQLSQINAKVELADLRVKRYTMLYQKQAIDKDHLDEAIAHQKEVYAQKEVQLDNIALANLGARADQIDAQASRLNQAKFAVEFGNWKESQKKLYAPVDGHVFDTYYLEGEYVVDNRPVLALLSDETIRVEFFVPARILPKIALNQRIEFTCEGCAPVNEAQIYYISSEAEYIPPLVYTRENQDKIVFKVKAKIANPELFKPGQPVDVFGIK